MKDKKEIKTVEVKITLNDGETVPIELELDTASKLFLEECIAKENDLEVLISLMMNIGAAAGIEQLARKLQTSSDGFVEVETRNQAPLESSTPEAQKSLSTLELIKRVTGAKE